MRILPARRALVSLFTAGLFFGGCGAEQSTPAVPDKTVPVLAFLYQGRSLSEWRALPASAPAEDRAAAAFALAALEQEPTRCIPQIVALLQDPDPSVRLAAVVATERLALPSREAATLIVRWLAVPEEPLRRQARLALGAMGAVALPVLEASLGDTRMLVRWGGLVALAQMAKGGVSAAALLAQVKTLAGDDPEASVRLRALFTLPHMGPEGLEATLTYLRGNSVQVRTEAAASLAQVGAPAVPALAALLSDEDEIVAALAAGILGDIGPAAREALPELVQALAHAGVVRSNAAMALIEIGQPSVASLQNLVEHADKDLAATVRYILEQINAR